MSKIKHGLYEYVHGRGHWYAGRIYMRCNYRFGLLHGKFEYWEDNGQLVEQCHYDNGVLVGVYRSWFDNGLPKKRCYYKQGRLHGKFEKFSLELGRLNERCYYNNGVFYGALELFDWHGVVIERYIYENDMFVERAKSVKRHGEYILLEFDDSAAPKFPKKIYDIDHE